MVDTLQNNELITASATQRAGNRPERTVYALTDAGTAELHDLVARADRDTGQADRRFEAGIR